jgi:Ca2+/Na+ antiporter
MYVFFILFIIFLLFFFFFFSIEFSRIEFSGFLYLYTVYAYMVCGQELRSSQEEGGVWIGK